MFVDSRWRAALVVTTIFAAGTAAGVALDRRILTRPEQQARPAMPASDQIPLPLRMLGLSDSESAQLHPIALRWRRQAALTLDSIRLHVNDLESGMFAEMLCVLQPAHREQYVKQLHDEGYPETVIARRMTLVRSGTCSPHQ